MKLIESSVQIIEEKDPYKMIELAFFFKVNNFVSLSV